MRRRRLGVLSALAMVPAAAVVPAPAWAHDDAEPDSPEPVTIDCGDQPALAAVFVGQPTQSRDDQLLFDEITVQEGDVSAPIAVSYPDGLPLITDDMVLRIRVSLSDDGYRSDVMCLATTTVDGDPLELDDDRLAAIARTTGEAASRAGRGALLGSVVLFAAVAVFTGIRRWRPRLW